MRLGWPTLSDAMRTIPGAEVMRTFSTESNVAFRGFNGPSGTSSGVLLLVDGRQTYLDITGENNWDNLPVALEEAALLDGCSRWMIFRKIVLPLARPALAVVALFSFLTAWNEYILAATFMNDPHSYTLPIVLQSYVTDYGTEWGNFAAGSILVSLPVVVLFFALQKHFVEGLTAGGVKG